MKVLRVNRSSYYKHFSSDVAPGIKENQEISRFILKIYADCDKRLGAYKIAHLLQRNYSINISVGRVYRLIKTLKLPRISTDKPFQSYQLNENAKECPHHLKQRFIELILEIIRDSLMEVTVVGRSIDQITDQVIDQDKSPTDRLLYVLGDEILSAAEHYPFRN